MCSYTRALELLDWGLKGHPIRECCVCVSVCGSVTAFDSMCDACAQERVSQRQSTAAKPTQPATRMLGCCDIEPAVQPKPLGEKIAESSQLKEGGRVHVKVKVRACFSRGPRVARC